MNTEATASAATGLGAADEAALTAERKQIKARIEHLFRYSLQRHQINPLMHLVWRYRLEVLEASRAAVQ